MAVVNCGIRISLQVDINSGGGLLGKCVCSGWGYKMMVGVSSAVLGVMVIGDRC